MRLNKFIYLLVLVALSPKYSFAELNLADQTTITRSQNELDALKKFLADDGIISKQIKAVRDNITEANASGALAKTAGADANKVYDAVIQDLDRYRTVKDKLVKIFEAQINVLKTEPRNFDPIFSLCGADYLLWSHTNSDDLRTRLEYFNSTKYQNELPDDRKQLMLQFLRDGQNVLQKMNGICITMTSQGSLARVAEMQAAVEGKPVTKRDILCKQYVPQYFATMEVCFKNFDEDGHRVQADGTPQNMPLGAGSGRRPFGPTNLGAANTGPVTPKPQPATPSAPPAGAPLGGGPRPGVPAR